MNKMFSIKFVALSLILSAVVLSVNAIRCYQCNSAEHTQCHDLSVRPHLTAPFYKECNSFEQYGNFTPFCRKTVVEILLPEGEKRTTRSCGWVRYRLPCYKADNDDHLETSCQCFEDGCNGSSHIYTMSAVSLTVLSLICLKL